MNEILFQRELLDKIPTIRLGCISCKVDIKPSDEKIKTLSETIIKNIQSQLTIDSVSQKPTIKATKVAYRKLGKDPSRYRPSAEALTRRVVKGNGLYWINSIVDLLNLISLESGFSIGGYDMGKIVGNIEFGVGKVNEPYQAIGRGALNIESLPLFRDDKGAFGSPTSDSIRTMVTNQTSQFLMIIIDFDHQDNLEPTIERSVELLEKYASVTEIETELILATRL